MELVRRNPFVGPEHDLRFWNIVQTGALTLRIPLQRPIGFHTWVAHVVKVANGRPVRSSNAWILHMGSDRDA